MISHGKCQTIVSVCMCVWLIWWYLGKLNIRCSCISSKESSLRLGKRSVSGGCIKSNARTPRKWMNECPEGQLSGRDIVVDIIVRDRSAKSNKRDIASSRDARITARRGSFAKHWMSAYISPLPLWNAANNGSVNGHRKRINSIICSVNHAEEWGGIIKERRMNGDGLERKRGPRICDLCQT